MSSVPRKWVSQARGVHCTQLMSHVTQLICFTLTTTRTTTSTRLKDYLCKTTGIMLFTLCLNARQSGKRISRWRPRSPLTHQDNRLPGWQVTKTLDDYLSLLVQRLSKDSPSPVKSTYLFRALACILKMTGHLLILL